jgi:tricorn protease
MTRRRTLHLPALLVAAAMLMACTAALLVAMPEKAEAIFSGKNGRIAYSVYDGNDQEIYTIKLTGGKLIRVTKNDTYDSSPDYSPDGKKIAYAARNEADEEIYTINATGGKFFQVTNNSDKDDYAPSYSPNGKKIAYAGLDADTEETELYTVRATGGEPFQITHDNFWGSLNSSWGSRP